MGKSVLEGLTTPELVVDMDIPDRNFSRMAAANAFGFALRPHAKTHKCPRIAWRRIEAGARGLSASERLGTR